MKLNTLLAGFVLAAAALVAVAAARTYAGIVPTETPQTTVLVADGPGPENPPPIIIW